MKIKVGSIVRVLVDHYRTAPFGYVGPVVAITRCGITRKKVYQLGALYLNFYKNELELVK